MDIADTREKLEMRGQVAVLGSGSDGAA